MDPRMSLRRLAGPALSLAVAAGAAAAQAGPLHLLHNGTDVLYAGVGAGGATTASDGVGTWIDGERLRGNTLTALGDFGYRNPSFIAELCHTGAAQTLEFPTIVFVELDGLNANRPDIFLKPTCGPGGALPGITSGGFLPYGTTPGASASFFLLPLGSGSSIPSTAVLPLIPNHGLLPASGGSATLIAAASGNLAVASTGLCWNVEFTWLPTSLPSLDHIDGWWYWAQNGSSGSQYWALSNDELNAFQSHTVGTLAGQTQLAQFFSNVELGLTLTSSDAVTHTTLAPTGFHQDGAFVCLPVTGPNTGFDIGRHQAVSLSGLGGATNAVTGLATQDPAAVPGTVVPSLGFATWVPGGLGASGMRTVFVQVDWDGVFGLPPDAGTEVTVWGGPSPVRLPVDVPSSGPAVWPQPITNQFLVPLLHDAGTVHPLCTGPVLGLAGVTPPPVFGVTVQLPLASVTPVCQLGVPVFLSYGSVGVTDTLDDLLFDPAQAVVSGSGEILVID